MGEIDALELADRFFGAIVKGDLGAVREIYAPDAVIWHNTEDREQTRDENLAVLGWVIENVADFRYEDVRRERTETGFIEQHVTCGTHKAGGGKLRMPAVIVCRVSHGRITRLDEYFDSAQLRDAIPDLQA